MVAPDMLKSRDKIQSGAPRASASGNLILDTLPRVIIVLPNPALMTFET
jgi:hypothetical protein